MQQGTRGRQVWTGAESVRVVFDADDFAIGTDGRLSPETRAFRQAVYIMREERHEYRQAGLEALGLLDARGVTIKIDTGEVVGPDYPGLDKLPARDRLFETRGRGAPAGVMSKGSKASMWRTLLEHSPTFVRPGWTALYSVLTVGDRPPMVPAEWAQWIEDLCRKLDFHFGEWETVISRNGKRRRKLVRRRWVAFVKLAFQWQGRIAPHWDVLVSVQAEITAQEWDAWLSPVWVDVSGLHGSALADRLIHGVRNSSTLADIGGVFGYVAMREVAADKVRQNTSPVPVARWWRWHGGARDSLGECGHDACEVVEGRGYSRDIDYETYTERMGHILDAFFPTWEARLRPDVDHEAACAAYIAEQTRKRPELNESAAGWEYLNQNLYRIAPSRVAGAWAHYIATGDWSACAVVLAKPSRSLVEPRPMVLA